MRKKYLKFKLFFTIIQLQIITYISNSPENMTSLLVLIDYNPIVVMQKLIFNLLII